MLFEESLSSIFGYIVLGIIFLGLLLYFLNSFIFIGKGRVGIIERMGEYIGTYGEGMHLFAPFIYRRVGYYKLEETKLYITINRVDYIVVFKINNFQKYHYVGGHDAEGIVKASLFDSSDNLSQLLTDRFKSVGATFISLEKIKRGR